MGHGRAEPTPASRGGGTRLRTERPTAGEACLIALARPLLFAGIIGALILAAVITNLLLLPHPVWFAVTAVVAVPLAALLAGRFAPRRSPHDPVWLP